MRKERAKSGKNVDVVASGHLAISGKAEEFGHRSQSGPGWEKCKSRGQPGGDRNDGF